MYTVVNYRQKNKVVGVYKTKIGARRAVDRLDNEYGAYSYRISISQIHHEHNTINVDGKSLANQEAI